MKTPREVILDHHQHAEARLNELQPGIIAACARESQIHRDAPPRTVFGVSSLFTRFWEEAIRPWRRAWMSMAVIWAGIIIAHLSTGQGQVGGMAKAPAKESDPQVKVVLLEQKRFLAQLLEPMNEPRSSRVTTSGPRSERRVEEVIV